MIDEALIGEGQRLVTMLDATPAKPRAAAWVPGHGPRWRLWLVPPAGMSLQEFNVIAAGTIAAHSGDFSLLDTQSIVARPADDPAIRSLRMSVQVDGLSAVQLSGNTFNGVKIPDCVVLRMQF